jgi:DNA transposition AAA+ family ATPase
MTEDPHAGPMPTDGPRVIARMAAEGRILLHARRLPMDGPIESDAIEAVRQAYKRYTYQSGVTDAQAAKEIGYSSSVLSQWKDASYRGDVEEVTRRVNAWMDDDARARRHTFAVPYVPTQVCEGMRNIVRVAHARQKMVAVIMPAGTGKSMMLEILATDLRGFVVYCHKRMKARAFLSTVAETVKAKPQAFDCAGLMKAIVERLRGSKRPLLLDEAHLLQRDVFADVRAIYDQTGCTIVMAGTDEMISCIDDRAGGRGQMASRCLFYDTSAHYMNIEDPGRTSAQRPLYTKEEIQAFLDASNVKIDPDAFTMLWALACMPDRGCWRLMGDIVATAIGVLRVKRISRANIWQCLEIAQLGASKVLTNRAEEFVDRCRRLKVG